jgi:hypothetical protein
MQIRTYKVVRSDDKSAYKFSPVSSPRAHAIYLPKSYFSKANKPKIGEVVRFKRKTTRYTTEWIPE